MPSAERGEVEIEVTFTIDANGILNVRAHDTRTNQETEATMRVVGAPTEEEEAMSTVPPHVPSGSGEIVEVEEDQL